MIYLKSDDVLLFQGDSITHGGRGLSQTDLNHVIGHGYQDTIAQTLGLANIERRPTILNRGVSGDDLARLHARKQADLFDLKPTILSLLIGTNDASHAIHGTADLAPEKYERCYRDLLDEVKAAFPGIRLILGQPFRYPRPDGAEPELQKPICDYVHENAVIVESIARDYGAVFVRYGDIFDEWLKTVPLTHLIWDGIHPTYVGHAIMAKAWLEAAEAAWGV